MVDFMGKPDLLLQFEEADREERNLTFKMFGKILDLTEHLLSTGSGIKETFTGARRALARAKQSIDEG